MNQEINILIAFGFSYTKKYLLAVITNFEFATSSWLNKSFDDEKL